MSRSGQPRGRRDFGSSSPDPLARLERQIAGVQTSIVPGARFRDTVLQRVSDSDKRVGRQTRVAWVTVVFSLVLVAVSPLIGALTRVDGPSPQTAERANSDALELSQQGRLSFDWALVDVFAKFRDDKSAAINDPKATR